MTYDQFVTLVAAVLYAGIKGFAPKDAVVAANELIKEVQRQKVVKN
jgi:hypothetical protein